MVCVTLQSKSIIQSDELLKNNDLIIILNKEGLSDQLFLILKNYYFIFMTYIGDTGHKYFIFQSALSNLTIPMFVLRQPVPPDHSRSWSLSFCDACLSSSFTLVSQWMMVSVSMTE